MRRVATAVSVVLFGAIVLFFGYAAFSAAGDVDFDGDWPTAYVVIAGLILDGLGIAIMLGALRVLRADTTGRWSIVFLAETALATLPFRRFLDSKWGLLITAAMIVCAFTALARAGSRQYRRS